MDAHLKSLARRVPSLAEDLRVLEAVEWDPPSALNKIRFVTERVLLELARQHAVTWGNAEPTVERLIGPLVARGVIPKKVAIHVRTIQTNASPGSHYQEESLDAAHVDLALRAFIELLTWRYPHPTATKTPPRPRSRARLVAFALGLSAVGAVIAALVLHGRSASLPTCPGDMRPIPEATVWISAGQGLAGLAGAQREHVDAFCMDTTEVTADAYHRCVGLGGCVHADQIALRDLPDGEEARRPWLPHCNGMRPDRGSHPINCVTYEMAVTYCAWLGAGRRLPTEPEWVAAARGSGRDPYTWGDEPPGSGRLNVLGPSDIDTAIAMLGSRALPIEERIPAYPTDDGFADTAPVGSFPNGASPYGVLDLLGNVSEWTSTPWQPPDETQYVLRGSPWTFVGRADGGARAELTIDFRRAYRREYAGPTLGFRCAADP